MKKPPDAYAFRAVLCLKKELVNGWGAARDSVTRYTF